MVVVGGMVRADGCLVDWVDSVLSVSMCGTRVKKTFIFFVRGS